MPELTEQNTAILHEPARIGKWKCPHVSTVRGAGSGPRVSAARGAGPYTVSTARGAGPETKQVSTGVIASIAAKFINEFCIFINVHDHHVFGATNAVYWMQDGSLNFFAMDFYVLAGAAPTSGMPCASRVPGPQRVARRTWTCSICTERRRCTPCTGLQVHSSQAGAVRVLACHGYRSHRACHPCTKRLSLTCFVY